MKNRILDGLKRVGLEKYFNPNHIYSFDLVDNPKPHPDIYLKAVNDNDLIIDETIIIEDSVVGVNAGKNANIKVIGLTAGGHWHTDRDEKELINAGAIATANNYNKIEEIIESFKMGPAIKGNPLQMFVYLLVLSYVVGEFIIPKYTLISLLNIAGLIGLISSLALFFSSLNLFNSYKENPKPQTHTKRIIKTGILLTAEIQCIWHLFYFTLACF